MKEPNIWKEISLDVSELEAPEPLERAVEALDKLADQEFLCMHHRREPCLLYPILEGRKCSHRTQQLPDGMVEILIWHSSNKALSDFLENDR